MGEVQIIGSEYSAQSGSTIKKIVAPGGHGIYVGQALLIKNGLGYEIRNVKEVDGNDIYLNFDSINAAPNGTLLGIAITYKPAPQGHPTFSATKYLGNGHAIEATAGNTVTELSLTADANGFGEVEFSYGGTKYFFNPVAVDGTNNYLDFVDDAGTHAALLASKTYKTPLEFCDALKAAMEAVSPTQAFKVSYSKVSGLYSIEAVSSAVFSILFGTGANAANSVKDLMGYSTIVDITGSLVYESDVPSEFSAPLDPVYDSADAIIIKGAELFIGNDVDNACICAQSVSLTISKETEDVDCICEETGVKEKIAVSRSVEMSVTAVLNKFDATLLDALLKNSGVSAMLNAGPKTGGNWIPGKCFNVYIQNCTVSSYTTTGDSFIQAEITLKGFVTSTQKDVYLNFV